MPNPLGNENFKLTQFKLPEQNSRKEGSLWNRVFARFRQKPDNALRELTHKITELDPKANIIHKELLSLTSNFSHNESIYPHLHEVVAPMIREIEQIRTQLVCKPSQNALEKYSLWTEKAQNWVKLCNQEGSEEKVTQAIMTHIFEKSLELIDRDTQLIEEYKNHQNSNADVIPYIQKLQDLKNIPKISLEKISEWRAQLDIKRAALVNSALKALDKE